MCKAPKSIHISYAITVCNEAAELEALLLHLKPFLREGDELVVQADKEHVTKEVKGIVEQHRSLITTYAEHPLNFDFAQAKNHLNGLCNGDFIFQLDADELPQPWLLEHLREIIGKHPWIELFKIPRINLFQQTEGGIVEERVAWPDYQGRLYKNRPNRIRWRRPLHERIHGHLLYWHLPKEDNYAILPVKLKTQDDAKWAEWRKHYQA